MTNDKTPPSVVYIAFGNTLYNGTPNIRLWTADAEQARIFEQETGAKAHEYRLASAARATAEQSSVVQPALYDERALFEAFEAARAGSDKPAGVLRGIRAVMERYAAAPQPPQQAAPAATPNERRYTLDEVHQALLDAGTFVDSEREEILAILGSTAQAAPAKIERFNPADGSPETALQMAAVIALRDEGKTAPAAVAVAALVREALETASNGLGWYRDQCPDAVDGSDDEADALIARALAAIDAAPQPPVAAQGPTEHPDTTRLRTLAALTGNWPLDLRTEHDLQIRETYPSGPTTLEAVRWVLDLIAGGNTLRESQPPAAVREPVGLPYGIIDPDYARVYTIARVLAWQYGFALTMHGSFTRDLDLVLVPWAGNAFNGAVDCIIKMLCEACDLSWDGTHGDKPHGRKAYTLVFKKFSDPRWIDLSVLPVSAPVAQGDADTLQGAANWLLEALDGCRIADLQSNLKIGFNRAQRLMQAALAARAQAKEGASDVL